MLKFFDYVYYCLCKFYYKIRGEGAGISALAVIALIQFVNLLLLIFLYDLISHTKFKFDKVIAVLVYIILLILNGIRYNKLNYAVLSDKLKDEQSRRKKVNETLVILYIVLSFSVCLALAIYLGSKK